MNFELSPRRAAVLTALLRQPGHEIQDPDGQATALLMVDTGHRTTNALSGVMMQLEMAGYIERDVSGGRRTYRIALTDKGRDAAEKLVGGLPVEDAPDAEVASLRAKVQRLEQENANLKDKLIIVLLGKTA